VAAVIIEGIQGVAGIYEPKPSFLQQLEALCTVHKVVLILDEIQSGYGRTGQFFAHQVAGIKPDRNYNSKRNGKRIPHWRCTHLSQI